MDNTGNLFVIAAPSGAGKSSLVKALLAGDARLRASVSHTTRAPRGQERDGQAYYFVTPTAFDALVKNDAFVEWAHVHGQQYGTSRQMLQERMVQGNDVVLEIDFQGAQQIRRLFPQAVLVFILPPSWDELRARLERRGEDTPEVIALRLRNAATEVAHVTAFDFVIINELFETALSDLKAIVRAQRLRLCSQQQACADTFKSLLAP
ncbi:MAG: guanylate kinase [Burkholderiaceae bacterium]